MNRLGFFKKLSDVTVPRADVPQDKVFHIRLAGQPRRFLRRAVVGVLGPCCVPLSKGAIVVQQICPSANCLTDSQGRVSEE